MSPVLGTILCDPVPPKSPEPYTNSICPGQIDFVYGSGDLGSTGSHKHVPETGDILLFPSQLKHIAYPFHTEGVTRVSMSFNIVNWNVPPIIIN